MIQTSLKFTGDKNGLLVLCQAYAVYFTFNPYSNPVLWVEYYPYFTDENTAQSTIKAFSQ